METMHKSGKPTLSGGVKMLLNCTRFKAGDAKTGSITPFTRAISDPVH